MAKIRRAFDWISEALDARSARVIPVESLTTILPGFDVFGTEQVANMRFETVQGVLGGIETTGGLVPPRRWRHYLTMQGFHDDTLATRILALMRVPNVNGVFPQVILQNDITLSAFFSTVERNVAVGPGQRGGVRAFTMGAAASLFFQGLFIEMDVGEYLKLEGQS